MISSVRPLLLIAGMLATVAACGGSSQRTGYPSVTFVGNSTCPTSGASSYAPSPPNVNSLPPVGEAIDEMPHTHVAQGTQVSYNHNPPTSGCHYNLGYGNAPIQSGVYNQEIPPEYWVHNLEHGYVVVLFNCPTGCDTQFQQLRNWYHSLQPENGFSYPKAVVLPDTSMSVPFAAVSWDWYLPIPVFKISEVQRFYDNHHGNGDEGSGQ